MPTRLAGICRGVVGTHGDGRADLALLALILIVPLLFFVGLGSLDWKQNSRVAGDPNYFLCRARGSSVVRVDLLSSLALLSSNQAAGLPARELR
jgi:hypothetical protein